MVYNQHLSFLYFITGLLRTKPKYYVKYKCYEIWALHKHKIPLTLLSIKYPMKTLTLYKLSSY